MAFLDDTLAYMPGIASLIEEFGLPGVGMPYVGLLRDRLCKMRGRGRDGIARSIYIGSACRRVIMLRAFIKKSR